MGNDISLLFGNDKNMPKDISKAYVYKLHTKKTEDLTGWQRIKMVFETDMYGESSPELKRCTDTICITVIVAALLGGAGRSRIAYRNFFHSNMHTAFETPSVAKRKLQEAVMMGFGSGAFRIGWRAGAFCTVYAFGSTCFSAYRGKASFLDPVVGGAAAGFVYKLHEGPKLTLAGTVIGGLLGLVAGGFANLGMSLAGVTTDEVLAQYRQDVYDQRQKDLEKLKASRPPEQNKITLDQFHAQILNEGNVSGSSTNEESSQNESETKESSQPANRSSSEIVNVSSNSSQNTNQVTMNS